MVRGPLPGHPAATTPRGAVVVPRSWGLIQFERARQDCEGCWYETLRDDRFGQTVALVGRMPACPQSPDEVIGMASRGALIVVHADWIAIDRQLRSFMRDAGLSPAVARLTAAVFRFCGVRTAAAAAGLSYETARGYLKCARSAVGAGNLPRLVTLIGESIPCPAADEAGNDRRLLADILGLSPRQMLVASMAAAGATRREIALHEGMSETLVKKELAVVFTVLGIGNVIGLARTMVELRLLAPAAAFLRNGPSEHLLPPMTGSAIKRTLLTSGRGDEPGATW